MFDPTVRYYFHDRGKNAARPWVVVERGGEWERVLKSRGWRPEMCYHTRAMTEAEIRESNERSRHMSWRYATVAELLEDEWRSLGEDSDAYRKLESRMTELERRLMPRAKRKAVETAEATPLAESIEKHKEKIVNGAETNGRGPEFQFLLVDRLKPSATNPRKRFPESSIAELAESIKEQGVLEPLIVRRWSMVAVETPRGADYEPTFEIVCGERRYRAAKAAGLETVPCLIRELTDEQVLDIQIHENLHREDVHPMDEAFGYKFLQERLGCDIHELSLRVGKSEAYVLNRLKLNQLIPEVQKDVEDGLLPIGHALEIAKFAPDSQLAILNNGAYETESKHNSKTGNWEEVPIKDRPTLLPQFRDWIAEKVLWRLAKAPFDRKATNLRTDGLACSACPNRTGANALLFEEELAKKNNDSCLDPACWQNKAKKHVQIKRERLAHEASVAVDDLPLVDMESWRDVEGVLGYESVVQIVEGKVDSWDTRRSNKKCGSSVTTVDVGRKNYGRTIEVCLPSSGCKVHFGKGKSTAVKSAGTSDSKADDSELIKKRERREEIFDMRVSDLVRQRVFRLAADKFADSCEISNAGNAFLPRLVAKIWVNSNNGEAAHTRGMANTLMSNIMDLPQGHFDLSNFDLEKATKAAERLSERNLKIVLFFLVHGEKGHTYYDRMNSQKAVLELAEEYNIDYTLLDAQVRVEVAQEKAKKHLDLFKAYLAEVEAGKKNAKIPRPYAPTYRSKA